MFLHASITLIDEREPMPRGLEILLSVAFPAVSGGILGIFEGAYLGPLAWLLGAFGNWTALRTSPDDR